MAPAAPARANPARFGEPLNEQVYQRLKWALMVGDYLPGSKLSIRSVAAGMGISTMPVREALKRLVSERALASSANRSFRIDRLAPKRVSDLFFLRACLEGIATELATPLLIGAQIDRLDELATLTSADVAEDDMGHYLVHNYNFHFTIYTAAGNAELVSIIEGLWAQTGPYLRAGYDHRLRTLEWEEMHGPIAKAIRARDAAGARSLIERDISWGTEVYNELDRFSRLPHPTSG